jgi:hypothetical protein
LGCYADSHSEKLFRKELLCVKKFPPNPLQETLLPSAFQLPSKRGAGRPKKREVFGEGAEEKPFFRKVLPRLLL